MPNDVLIYFAQRTDGAIKVGSTNGLETRMAALQREYGQALTVLLTFEAMRADEAVVHRILRRFKLLTGRELYAPDPDLLMIIRKMQRKLAFEPYPFQPKPRPKRHRRGYGIWSI